MAIASTTSKAKAQAQTFVGISSLFLKKGGFKSTKKTQTVGTETITYMKVDLVADDLIEVPCSQDSGFSFDGGTPSINNFKIHGMTAAYTSTFTPGDGSLTVEIPTAHTDILDLLYGTKGTEMEVNLVSTDSIGGKQALHGKAYPFSQVAVHFGILAISDDETKALFFKDIKATATPAFDGSEKPYAITLTATISGGAETDAVAILEPAAAYAS